MGSGERYSDLVMRPSSTILYMDMVTMAMNW